MIQSVERAASIMNALAASSGRLGVSELCTRLGLAKGTVHGLLKTLRAQGLVEKDPESDKYQLGPTLLMLSNRYLYLNELRSRALAWSEDLAGQTHESVRVGLPHDHGVMIVHHVFRPDAGLQILEVGAVLPLHATALGKAVLAHLGEEQPEPATAEELPKLTGRTLTTPDELQPELDATRSRGYAVEREEAILGESSVAAPIFGRRGEVVGAIGIVGPTDRMLDDDGEPQSVAAVIDAARGISRELGAPQWARAGAR